MQSSDEHSIFKCMYLYSYQTTSTHMDFVCFNTFILWTLDTDETASNVVCEWNGYIEVTVVFVVGPAARMSPNY